MVEDKRPHHLRFETYKLENLERTMLPLLFSRVS